MIDTLDQLTEQIAACRRLKLPEMQALLQTAHDEIAFLRAQAKALKSQLTLGDAALSVVVDRVNGHG